MTNDVDSAARRKLMPSTKSYKNLGAAVEARPGADERLDRLRRDTLAEIGLYELRRTLERSQAEVAALLEVSQSAISQLEHSADLRVSTLRGYLEKLGATLRVEAVFGEDDDEWSVPLRIGQPETAA
ncbi:MAG: XRE family transcriptional regulator [Actinomycetota bacterium]